jgi:hypothetical protein
VGVNHGHSVTLGRTGAKEVSSAYCHQGEEAAVQAPVAAQKLERVAPVSYRQGGDGVALEVLARAAASGTAETAVHRRQRRFYFFTIFTLLFNSMNCLRYNILNLVLIKKIFKYTLVFLEFSKKNQIKPNSFW